MVDIAFFVIGGFVIVSAIFALEARELIYGAVGLAFSLIGVAGLFILLGADYLAMFQISVYVGAVVVLILFTIMLVRRESGKIVEQEEPSRLGRAGVFVAGLVALAMAGAVIVLMPVSVAAPVLNQVTLRELGQSLASAYAVPLVILGLLIGVTIVGGLTLVMVQREKKSNGTTQ